jgi:hypothetical protein
MRINGTKICGAHEALKEINLQIPRRSFLPIWNRMEQIN